MISRLKISVCAATLTGILAGIALSGTVTHAAIKPLSKTDAKIYSTALAAAAKGNWLSAHRQTSKIRNKLPAKVLRWLELSQRGNRKSFGQISEFVLKNDN
jgi:hypothetical protein